MTTLAISQNVAINDTGLEPHPSAILDLQANDKGLLIPRLDALARQAITDPAAGLLVYQTGRGGGFYYYDGDRWMSIERAGNAAGNATDADGNSYATAVIGEQQWMLSNLEVTHFRNGDPVPFAMSSEQWSNAEAPAFTAYNGLPENYRPDYGLLYNAYAAGDSRGLCPEGWRVPSLEDWAALATHLGEGAGGKLKALEAWELPNTGASNSSGFSAMPGGYRAADGQYAALRLQGVFWASDEASRSTPMAIILQNVAGEVIFEQRHSNEGLSVRCIKD